MQSLRFNAISFHSIKTKVCILFELVQKIHTLLVNSLAAWLVIMTINSLLNKSALLPCGHYYHNVVMQRSHPKLMVPRMWPRKKRVKNRKNKCHIVSARSELWGTLSKLAGDRQVKGKYVSAGWERVPIYTHIL